MDYGEFLKKSALDLKGSLEKRGFNTDTSVISLKKLQDQSYDGINVIFEGSNAGLVINAMLIHEALGDNISYDSYIEALSDYALNFKDKAPVIDADFISDYSLVKKLLMIQLISRKNNSYILDEIPHTDIADLCMVYRIAITDNANGLNSVLITNDMLEKYGVSKGQLHADAVKYCSMRFPLQLKEIGEVIEQMNDELKSSISDSIPDDLDFITELEKDTTTKLMYVATNQLGINGAGVLAYPNFFSYVTERLESDYFILPSSIHELIIIKDNGVYTCDGLKEMVHSVNITAVEERDYLSDNVYHYTAELKLFETSEEYTRRIQQFNGTESYLEAIENRQHIN